MMLKTAIFNKCEKGHWILLTLCFIPTIVCLTMVQTSVADSAPIPSIVNLPQGLEPVDHPETFKPDNLYEKIDGQAELYLSAGFVGLKCQWFGEVGDPDPLFEVFIYDMGDGSNAFSVYSKQRREEAQKLDLTEFAYRTENFIQFVHGPYYVEMVAVISSKTLLSKMTWLAKNFVENTHVNTPVIEGLGFFPKRDLKKDSIAMISRNAFGFDKLDRVYTATYIFEEGPVTAFISKRKTSADAQELVLGLHKFFMAFGGKDIMPHVAIKNIKIVEVMDSYYMMFSFKTYLAGVHEASRKNRAEYLAEMLVKRLKEMSDG